jgi:hypothetical protein
VAEGEVAEGEVAGGEVAGGEVAEDTVAGDGLSTAGAAKDSVGSLKPQSSVPGETGTDSAGPKLNVGASPPSASSSLWVLPAGSWPLSVAAASVGPSADEESLTSSIAASPAGGSLVTRALRAVCSDAVPFGAAVLTEAGRPAGLRAVRLDAAMMSDGRVSWSLSPSRSSPSAREVTMVGEAPPEPPGLFVRLSKPSSL